MIPTKFNPQNIQVEEKNPHNGRITIIEIWSYPIGQFTVRAGANSDFSYTGFVPDCKSLSDTVCRVMELNDTGKLFK